jgi:2'-phosphotransferase
MIPASSLDQTPTSDATQEQPQPPLANITESEDPADYLIRANQGHSINVDTEGLLTPISIDAGNVPSTVVHGTDERAWTLISKSGGLRRMGRNHIHFASGLPEGFKSVDASTGSAEEKESAPVISGMRKNSTILVYVDIEAAMKAGIKFFVSENGVILSEGNEEGFLPYKFFKRVESRKKDGGVLMSEGKLPEGVVVNIEEWEQEVGDVQKAKRGGRGGGRGGRGGRGGKAQAKDDSRDVMAGV